MRRCFLTLCAPCADVGAQLAERRDEYVWSAIIVFLFFRAPVAT